MFRVLPLIASVVLTGCLSFPETGLYACDPQASIGCVTDDGGQPIPSNDGGGPVFLPDGGVSTTVGPITGQARRYGVSGGMPLSAPRLPTNALVRVWVQTASGWNEYPGTLNADGTFVVPGVPQGVGFYLRVDYDFVYSTKRSGFDLNVWWLGRPDNLQYASAATPLTVNVTDLVAWNARDLLLVSSLGTGLVRYSENAPAEGAVSFNGVAFDFFSRRLPLIDSSRGDTLHISQLRYATTPGFNYQGLRKDVTVAPFSLTSGQGQTVNAQLAEVAQQTATLDWRRADFAAFKAISTPAGSLTTDSELYLRATPSVSQFGVYDVGPNLVSHYSVNETANVSPTVSFGNPFGTEISGEAAVYFSMQYTAAGATQPTTLYAYNWVMDSLTGFTTKPIAPRISPVRDFKIQGKSALENQGAVGLTPTLTWLPPATGTANIYALLIYNLYNEGGVSKTSFDWAVATSTTQIALPPGVLQSGKQYVFALVARQDPARTPETPWVDSVNNAGRSDVLTGIISPD